MRIIASPVYTDRGNFIDIHFEPAHSGRIMRQFEENIIRCSGAVYVVQLRASQGLRVLINPNYDAWQVRKQIKRRLKRQIARLIYETILSEEAVSYLNLARKNV